MCFHPRGTEDDVAAIPDLEFTAETLAIQLQYQHDSTITPQAVYRRRRPTVESAEFVTPSLGDVERDGVDLQCTVHNALHLLSRTIRVVADLPPRRRCATRRLVLLASDHENFKLVLTGSHLLRDLRFALAFALWRRWWLFCFGCFSPPTILRDVAPLPALKATCREVCFRAINHHVPKIPAMKALHSFAAGTTARTLR